jgi:SRSO17 transposase
MTAQQIRGLAPRISEYLDEFADCFVTFDTRYHLKEYVQGQLSNLPRKSVEPIAHLMDVAPRTLQEFLSYSEWDHDRLRDTLQRMVRRDHSEPQAIGIIDESGHVKKGNKTACVQRQYCGASGKIDNCVMSVHLCYASFDGKFRAMLDSDLYLPEKGWDAARRGEAGIPEAVVYRAKHEMGLDQLRRALASGMRFGWIVADEWYGEKPSFIEGLEESGQRFVLEIPRNLMGWTRRPVDADVPRGEVQNLARWSRPMAQQPWTDFHIKDSGMGAMVLETRSGEFWMKRDGRVIGPYWLIATRDRLDQQTIKYFLSNAPAGVPLEVLLHVGFSRWPVERCLEDEKSELGLSHFEARKYEAVLRHLRITQVSHLFLARQTRRLAEKKSPGHNLPGARRQLRVVRCLAAERAGPEAATGQSREDHSRNTEEKHGGADRSCRNAPPAAPPTGHSFGEPPLLHPATGRIAL